MHFSSKSICKYLPSFLQTRDERVSALFAQHHSTYLSYRKLFFCLLSHNPTFSHAYAFSFNQICFGYLLLIFSFSTHFFKFQSCTLNIENGMYNVFSPIFNRYTNISWYFFPFNESFLLSFKLTKT